MEVNFLSTLFTKNLAYLSQALPELQQQIMAEKPSSSDLFEENGELDVYINNERFYNMDARLACQLQVQHFMSHPSHFSMQYKSKPGCHRIHQQTINDLNHKAQTLGYAANMKPAHTTLFMLGSGLGFQLEHLSQHFDFQNIIIVEPDNSMLASFIHYTDLRELSKQCNERGGRLTILQPASTQHFSQMVVALSQTQVFALLAEITLFRHYNTPLFDNIFQQFKALRYQWFSAWGFFDDELQGMRHTLANINKHKFADIVTQTLKPDSPVLIVGNGPSLNNDLSKIRRLQHAFIVVSCGTSLATLLRNDIVPDIHVEMERSEFSAEVQQKWLTPALSKNVLLLALNTVPPEITDKFASSLIFAKARDLGSHTLIQSLDKSINLLQHSNPTATNFAAAALINLGFKQLVLVGCDYGFRQVDNHHAQGSDYFDDDSQLAKAKYNPELTVKDNRGQPLNSTRVFNWARHELETLLSKHPEINCHNCSDGASIAHTKWQPLESIPNKLLDKNSIMNAISQPVQKPAATCKHRLKREFAQLQHITEKLQKDLRLYSHNTLTDRVNLISQYLEQQFKQYPEYVLFVGTFRYLSVVINGHLSRIHFQHRAEYERYAALQLANLLEGCLIKLTQLEKEIL